MTKSQGEAVADLRILVVEDDAASAKILQAQLRQAFEGASVAVAATGEQAFSLPLVEQDVILLDLNLPDVRGRETFEQIHRTAPLVPIILVTGLADERLCDSLLRSGAQDYLVKGDYRTSDLKRAIRYAIERQNLVVELARVRDDLRFAETESARAASEMRLHAAFTHSPVPAYLWERTGDDFECIDVNQAAERASPRARSIIGHRAAEFAAQRPEMSRAFQRLRSVDSVEALTFETRSLSNPARAITVTTIPIQRDRLLTYVEDRSSDDRAEEYRNVLDTAPVGIAAVSFDGRIRHVNATIASMLRYSTDDLVAMQWSQLLFPWDPPALDVIRDRGALRGEHALRRKDGMPVIADVASVVVNNDHILITTRDLTDLRMTQEHSAFQARLLASVKDAIIASDIDGGIIYWNHAAERMYGWTAEEATGRSRCDLQIPPESRDGAERAMALARETGHAEGEFVATRKDGTRIPVFVSISAMHDSSGAFSGLVSVSFDRSEIKEKDTLIDAILENLPVGVWLIDKSGTIVGSNPEARRIWGGARYESLSSMPYQAWFVDSGEQVTATTRPAYVTLKTHKPVLNVEMEIEAFDTGAHRWIVLSSVPVLAASGEILGVVVVNHDVTEKRAAQEALRRSEASFRSLIEHSSDIISILSASGVILYQSPPIRTILGYAPDTLLGHNIFAMLRPDDVDRTKEHFQKQLQSDVPLTLEVDLRHSSGQWRSFEVVTSRYEFEGETQIIANSRDVTDRNAMARSLEQAHRVAGLGRLAATIAHEINNVLMGIQPFAEVVRKKSKGHPDLERAADQITRSVRRGKTVTTEILRFTRPMQPQLTPMTVRTLFRSMEPELRTQLPESILFAIAARDDLSVLADKDQLSQVITNLVLNARDASPGAIDVVATGDDREVQITVTDTGEGIARDALPHIFEPLFTTKRNGTGLGLSVVQQIITAHNGRIEVDSEPGKGTRFTITLPARRES